MNSEERTKIMTDIKESLDFKGLSQAEYKKKFDMLFRANLINRGVCPKCRTMCETPDRAAMCCEMANVQKDKKE